MNWNWRKDRYGKPYISIFVYDRERKKNRRLTKSETAHIKTPEQAEQFLSSLKAQLASVEYRIEQRLIYKKKYHDFENLLKTFEVEMKKKAPVDFTNTVRDLEYYVFDFFLNKQGANNINDWHLLYSDFKDWLETEAKSVKGSRSISYSQRNSIISALNNFIGILSEKNIIRKTTPRCLRFPQSLIKRRSVEDVLSDEEAKDLLTVLRSMDTDVADFVYICLNVGGRFAEMLGLSPADYQDGVPNENTIKQILSQHNLTCYGYFSFNSQLANPSKPRNKEGHVVRKPLKHRKEISVSEYRIIPIFDMDAHNIIADRYNRSLQDLKKLEHGSALENYLLFNELTETKINKTLKSAYTRLKKYKPKTVHCFRHTFATNLSGKVSSDHRVFQLTMGHTDPKTTAGYNHIYQAISRSIATKRTIQLGGMKKVTKKS